MKKNQVINGKREGYWEGYYDYDNGILYYKGNYINGKREGYWEHYYNDGILYIKEYYII
jgi:antitoxin component YwqK of YwqJK toxin-antitoxin module